MQLLSLNFAKILAQIGSPFLPGALGTIVTGVLQVLSGKPAPPPVQATGPLSLLQDAVPIVQSVLALVSQVESSNPSSSAQDAEIKEVVHEVYALAAMANITIPLPESGVDAMVDMVYQILGLVGTHQVAALAAAPVSAPPPPPAAAAPMPATPPVSAVSVPAPVAAVARVIKPPTATMPSQLPERGSVPVQSLDNLFSGIGRGADL